MYSKASTHPCLSCFHNCNDFCEHKEHYTPLKEDKIYVLYEKESACAILGVFNHRLRAEEALDKVTEKALAEVLAIDPHESGIIDPSPREIEKLEAEIRNSFGITIFPEINVLNF